MQDCQAVWGAQNWSVQCPAPSPGAHSNPPYLLVMVIEADVVLLVAVVHIVVIHVVVGPVLVVGLVNKVVLLLVVALVVVTLVLVRGTCRSGERGEEELIPGREPR